MIIHHNGKRLTQGAVITSIVDLDQWSIAVNVRGPAEEATAIGPAFSLIFARPEFDRLVNHITMGEEDPAERILTIITSAADPSFFASSLDPRGAAGLKLWIERKLDDPYYQAVRENDYIMHARRYGFDALRFEQVPGLFSVKSGNHEAAHLRQQHRQRLEAKP